MIRTYCDICGDEIQVYYNVDNVPECDVYKCNTCMAVIEKISRENKEFDETISFIVTALKKAEKCPHCGKYYTDRKER